MTTSVHIVSIGARTPLGLRAAPGAAAYRAAISAMRDHPFMVDSRGDPMSVALDSQLDPKLMGAGRLLMLAVSALRECCAIFQEAPPLRNERLPIFLGLPEIRPGFTNADVKVIQSELSNINELPVDIADVRIFPDGHAAGLAALGAARNDIQQGKLAMCLVGGVDSYFHPDTMEWLDENRQIVSAASRSGFVPGEGAAFCLLIGEHIRRKLNLKSLATVRSVAAAIETKLIKTTEVCIGAGLTAAVQNTVNGLTLPSERINTVICDINGERYRGEEWGFVCLRLPTYFDAPTAYWSPADCWGDMGAASGPLFAMLACQATARGYANGPRTMLWASSEGGLRTATLLDTTNQLTS